ISRIRATLAAAPHHHNPGSAATFNTALIINDPSKYQSHGGISGLRVAQVRAIFGLPPQFSGAHLNQALAYVEWFTPLGNQNPRTGMHIISHYTRF
ncbi:hypothetical protein BD779DRAFT_1430018, partial [Infundibulicybe gibba]